MSLAARIRLGIFVLIAVSFPAALNAESRIALVIGNGAYGTAPLKNPANDAQDMARALGDYGFKVIIRTNADQREMRNAVREFGAALRRADVGLFYYAGHGIQVRGNNYLVPVRADIRTEADAEDLTIDANYVLRTMEDAQVKVNLVILDACRNNPFGRAFRSASRGLAHMSAASGSLIAFATAPGSVAEDGEGRNGVYTKQLLASLQHPDTDILKVLQRARAAVVKETAGRQTPWESTSLIGDFVFRAQSSAPEVAGLPRTVTTAQGCKLPAVGSRWSASVRRKRASGDELNEVVEFRVRDLAPDSRGVLVETRAGISSSSAREFGVFHVNYDPKFAMDASWLGQICPLAIGKKASFAMSREGGNKAWRYSVEVVEEVPFGPSDRAFVVRVQETATTHNFHLKRLVWISKATGFPVKTIVQEGKTELMEYEIEPASIRILE